MDSDPYLYDLPSEKIAARPVYPFHEARLLGMRREGGAFTHGSFADLPMLLGQDDVLVFNNSKVLKARLFGVMSKSSKAIEVLLLDELSPGRWRCLGKPLKKFESGTVLNFADDIAAVVIGRTGEYEVELDFGDTPREDIFHAGTMPIPPYIRKGHGDSQDEIDYQTAYAKHEGSVAAPTAGLHFTDELISVLDTRGVKRLEITLHVGPASFLPVLAPGEGGALELRKPGLERGVVSPEFVEQLGQYRLEKKRIIAVGTTVVRFLETIAKDPKSAIEGSFDTDLFIEPGYNFLAVDGLITNFHQPRSSHLLLVEAFMKRRELLEKAYTTALDEGYRFLSYGDGMFIE